MISKLIHRAAQSITAWECHQPGDRGGQLPGGEGVGERDGNTFSYDCDLSSAYPGCRIPNCVLTSTVTVSMNHGNDDSEKLTEFS